MKIYRYFGKTNSFGLPYIKFAYTTDISEIANIKYIHKNGKYYAVSPIQLSADLYIELTEEEKLELL